MRATTLREIRDGQVFVQSRRANATLLHPPHRDRSRCAGNWFCHGAFMCRQSDTHTPCMERLTDCGYLKVDAATCRRCCSAHKRPYIRSCPLCRSAWASAALRGGFGKDFASSLRLFGPSPIFLDAHPVHHQTCILCEERSYSHPLLLFATICDQPQQFHLATPANAHNGSSALVTFVTPLVTFVTPLVTFVKPGLTTPGMLPICPEGNSGASPSTDQMC